MIVNNSEHFLKIFLHIHMDFSCSQPQRQYVYVGSPWTAFYSCTDLLCSVYLHILLEYA